MSLEIIIILALLLLNGALVLTLLRKREHDVSEADINSLVTEGTEQGVVEEEERNIVARVFRLGDKKVASVMTPRTDVIWIRKEQSAKEAWETVANNPHNHYPVFDQLAKQAFGVVSAIDLASVRVSDPERTIGEIMGPVLQVPERVSLLRLLELFKKDGNRFAVVIDEFGSIKGIATLSNVVEEVLGDMGASDEAYPEIFHREDGSLLVDAGADIEEVLALLNLQTTEQQQAGDYHSLGGFIFNQLGHLPSIGEHFEYSGWKFEVVDMDRHRIDQVLITKVA